MEESKLQALHDTLSRLGGGKSGRGLGISSLPYSWSQKNISSSQLSANNNTTTTTSLTGPRTDGLPNNFLYANFVREGTYNPNDSRQSCHDGDGRVVLRDFSDIHPNQDESEDNSAESDDGQNQRNERTKKKKSKEERKMEKKAARKAMKLKAKKLAKLEEKRKLKKQMKIELPATAISTSDQRDAPPNVPSDHNLLSSDHKDKGPEKSRKQCDEVVKRKRNKPGSPSCLIGEQATNFRENTTTAIIASKSNKNQLKKAKSPMEPENGIIDTSNAKKSKKVKETKKKIKSKGDPTTTTLEPKDVSISLLDGGDTEERKPNRLQRKRENDAGALEELQPKKRKKKSTKMEPPQDQVISHQSRSNIQQQPKTKRKTKSS